MNQGVSFSWKQHRVVVAGGAGFVGSHLVDALVERGALVSVVDNLSSGARENLRRHAGSVELVDADVRDPATRRHFAGAELVVDCAACAPGVDPDQGSHERLFRENLEIGDAVREAALEAGARRFLFVSSSCVYPDDAPVPTPEMALEGTEPERANRGYGLAKRELERRALAAGDRLAVTIPRLFNVCGRRDLRTGRGAHVIPALLGRILDPVEAEVVVWGSGTQTRSFIDARDVAEALVALVETGSAGIPVNVGTASEVSLGDLARRLMEHCGVKKPLRFDLTKPEGALRKACDAGLLEQITGYRPRTPLESSLQALVQEWRESKLMDCVRLQV